VVGRFDNHRLSATRRSRDQHRRLSISLPPAMTVLSRTFRHGFLSAPILPERWLTPGMALTRSFRQRGGSLKW